MSSLCGPSSLLSLSSRAGLLSGAGYQVLSSLPGPLIYPAFALTGRTYALALRPWNESVRRSGPLVREGGISPITPLLGQIFDAHTVTENWFAGEFPARVSS